MMLIESGLLTAMLIVLLVIWFFMIGASIALQVFKWHLNKEVQDAEETIETFE